MKDELKTDYITVYMEPSLKDALAVYSENHHKSVARVVRELIKDLLIEKTND